MWPGACLISEFDGFSKCMVQTVHPRRRREARAIVRFGERGCDPRRPVSPRELSIGEFAGSTAWQGVAAGLTELLEAAFAHDRTSGWTIAEISFFVRIT